MAFLTSLAYPERSGGSDPGYLTPLITMITIGNVYRKQPCLVQNITHTIEGDASWDIDKQTPMSVVVNLGVSIRTDRWVPTPAVPVPLQAEIRPIALL